MTGDFADCVAVVTGGASGIGAATVQALLAAGARVAVFDIAESGSMLPDCRFHAVDVADRTAVEDAVAMVTSLWGGIDVLVNNAGIATRSSLESMLEDDWDRVLAVNLTGAYNCTRAVMPAMRARGGGAVINVASIAGKRISYLGGPNYTAAKAGLLGFTRHAAFELAAYGIRVNAVCPGPVLTPLVTRASDEAERAGLAAMVPLGRWVLPEDVADVILFLAGPGARMCTGTSIDVDGGALIATGIPYGDYLARRHAS